MYVCEGVRGSPVYILCQHLKALLLLCQHRFLQTDGLLALHSCGGLVKPGLEGNIKEVSQYINMHS